MYFFLSFSSSAVIFVLMTVLSFAQSIHHLFFLLPYLSLAHHQYGMHAHVMKIFFCNFFDYLLILQNFHRCDSTDVLPNNATHLVRACCRESPSVHGITSGAATRGSTTLLRLLRALEPVCAGPYCCWWVLKIRGKAELYHTGGLRTGFKGIGQRVYDKICHECREI